VAAVLRATGFFTAVFLAAVFFTEDFAVFFALFVEVLRAAVFLAAVFLTGALFAARLVVFDEARERADVAFLAGLMGAGR
jgi:hypothetical protein